jgi:hypothetical protein
MTKAEQRQAIAITADRSKRPRPMGFADVASGSAIRPSHRFRPVSAAQKRYVAVL